jgi:hypothetical protein
MMQKRTLYLSLLLVSCLLFFGFSYASAQTVTFESKTTYRCTDVTLNVTVDSPDDISALELIFEISGNVDGAPSVSFASGFTGLERRIGPIVDGNVYRMLAFKDSDDDCVDATGGVVVAQITMRTADVCDGTIEVNGTSITIPSMVCPPRVVQTGLVGCDPLVALQTGVVNGTVTIINRPPSIVCPGDTTYHWGDFVDLMAIGSDPDSCENLTYNVISGPGSIDNTGRYTWQTGGGDVCDHQICIEVVDKCNAADTCCFNICVYNIPPEIAHDPADTIFAVWGITLSGQVDATDPDGGPSALLYQVISFNGPTYCGNGLQLNPATGEWTWDICEDPAYLCDFELCIKVSDGANVCDPCSPHNADTACYNINVTGISITIEKVHHQLQGHNTTVSIFLDSGFTQEQFCEEIGGFDFLIAYDASALTATGAEPGALIDDDKWEYFTYRFGPFGNCGPNACPSGMIRVVGMKETNDGVTNPYHIPGPGELVILNFYVTNDYNFGGQFVPIQFFWFDCGDNTISDESGNWLYLGRRVYDFEGLDITDPTYGFPTYFGPHLDCYDTVYSGEGEYKNAPLGAIVFRNGGIDIEHPDSIDDRGDVNLNGIANEIADAVVFTNYFIKGAAAFTINFEGQKAATEINGDGFTLTVADLVYLIRIIVGDAQPLPKENPRAYAKFSARGDMISVNSNVDVGAALFVFDGYVTPSLAGEASHMELIYGQSDGLTHVLVYSMSQGRSFQMGEVLNLDGEATLVSVEAAEYRGATLKTTNEVLPTEFALKQNYPNPFNPVTTIKLELPVASDWKLTIFNVQGQRVKEFSGFSEVGTVAVKWDATNMASGLYFYKAEAGIFSATMKMVLLK